MTCLTFSNTNISSLVYVRQFTPLIIPTAQETARSYPPAHTTPDSPVAPSTAPEQVPQPQSKLPNPRYINHGVDGRVYDRAQNSCHVPAVIVHHG